MRAVTIIFPHLGRAGRLGNQLWQVASTIGIATKRGDQAQLPEDWDYRPYFRIPDEFFGPQEGIDASTLVPHIDPRAAVYLQDYSLWSHIKDEIKAWFWPSDMAFAALAHKNYLLYFSLARPVLAVQVRRGDNVVDPGTPDKHLYHPLRPLPYYIEGMDLAEPYASIAVFSDDPEWCRDHLPADYYSDGITRPKEHLPEYKESHPADWIDLFMMASADKHIIGNSTYGYWGAMLSKNESPFYPMPWFGPKLDYINAGLMFPASWRAIWHD